MNMHLDLTLLRSFCQIARCGSFAEASEALGIAQPTISLQMKRLEEQLGAQLFVPAGRGRKLSVQGQALLPQAEQMLQMNDYLVTQIRVPQMSGHLRIGLGQDFAQDRVLAALQAMRRLSPGVRIDLHIDMNRPIHHAFERGAFDVAVCAGDPRKPKVGEKLFERDLVWIGARTHDRPSPDRPLSLVLFPEPCIVREAIFEQLEQRPFTWHISCESPSLPGLMAATRAGLGVTARMRNQIDDGLQEHPPGEGLPALPPLEIVMRTIRKNAQNAQMITTLQDVLVDALMSPV